MPSEINLKAFSGGNGIKLEPNHLLLPENEDFLLLIKDLLDAFEAMENPNAIMIHYFKVIR